MYISIVCPISRKGSYDLITENLINILGPHSYEFVFVVDNKKLNALALEMSLNILREYCDVRNFSVLTTGNSPPPVFTMHARRNRIASNHNLIKENLGSSDFVFGFEDDTILPINALDKLLEDYKSLSKPGFIQGVQVGRWTKPYIGAWLVNDIKEPTKYTSLRPSKGTQEIDAGGFYCFLTPTDLYKEHEFGWDEPLGPDVQYSLNLRRKGYQNYIDWSVKTTHETSNGKLTVTSDVKPLTITYEGRWKYVYK